MKALRIVFALLALAVAFGATTLNAQGTVKKKNRAEVLTEQLGLSADQKKQVTQIYKDEQTQIKALGENPDKAKKQAIASDAKTKVRAVLTPEQQTKFDEINKPAAPAKKSTDKSKDKSQK